MCGAGNSFIIFYMYNAFSRTMAVLRAANHRRSSWGILIGVLLLGAWALWFLFGKMAIYEVSRVARIEVSAKSHPVQAIEPGRVVRAALVLDGDVTQGDILVELETEVQRLQLQEEKVRKEDLTSQLLGLQQEIATEEKALAHALAEGRVAVAESEARGQEKQVDATFNQEKVKRLSSLQADGNISELDLLEAKARSSRDLAEINTLRLTANRLSRKLRADESDRLVHMEKLRREHTQLSGQLAALTTSVQRLEHEMERRIIRAPVSGRLGKVAQLVPGSYVTQGDRVAIIVPRGKLVVTAEFLPATGLGRIVPGQPAILRLDAFPWTQYGSLKSSVHRVASEARDGILTVELDLLNPTARRIPLQHGLTGQVAVEVERVSPAFLVLRAAGKLLGGS